MVKKVRWSATALKSREYILEYWFLKNDNNNYSIRLAENFQRAIKSIQNFNQIGRKTNLKNVREFVLGNYSIFYDIVKNEIIILLIWDSRRNPEDLKLN